MISMTGYAYNEKPGQDFSVCVEIKGYNNRYLETSVNIPFWLSPLEVKIREKISEKCGRGKIDVYIRIREHNAPVNVTINKNAAKVFYDAVNELSVELGLMEKLSLSMILGLESVNSAGIFEIEKNRDIENYWNEIEPVLNDSINAFCIERKREGKQTKEDIMANMEKIEGSLKVVNSYISEIEQTLKDNIKTRFEELIGNRVDENRILAETASLLLKHTISEEVSRLTSHLGEFKKEAGKNNRPGKKLDFLCQEINREINTIGSKSVIIEVSSEVVAMKESLENIREQLRNIE